MDVRKMVARLVKRALTEKQEEYRKFFTGKLEEYGVESPAELGEEDKKKFFTEVNEEWTG